MRDTGTDLVVRPADAIRWYDGLLLEPAHFEQLCVRQEGLLAYQMRAAAPYAWGVRTLALDRGLLAENIVAITALEAIMPDGLLVTHAAGFPLRLEIDATKRERMAATGAPLKIYLAVTRAGQDGGAPRYRPCADGEYGADGGIERVRPAPRLVAEQDLNPGFDVGLPLAVLGYENKAIVVRPYLPPLLDIAFSPLDPQQEPLARRAQALRNDMATIASELGRQAAQANGAAEWQRRMDLRDQLRSVSAGLPLLAGLLAMDSVSPSALYLALCGVYGSLAMLQDWDKPAASLPAYQHDNLQECFGPLFARLQQLLERVETSYAGYPFAREAVMGSAAFQLAVRADWLQGWLVEPPPSAAQRCVLVVGLRGIGSLDAQRWMLKAAIASAAPLMRVRATRTMGAARSMIANDGTLVELKEGSGDTAADAPVALGRVDAAALRASDTTLFAIELDPALVLPDAPLVLDWAGLPRPAEVVLFVRNPPAGAAAAIDTLAPPA